MNYNGLEIAIIGMAGQFPGASDLHEFWQNLQDGVESTTLLTDEQLQKSGVAPSLLQHPDYVKVAATLENIECFDAEFFGFSPREAEILDPQHRLFLECAWSALEDAGYNAQNYAGAIAVYAGSAMNSYLLNLISHPTIQANVNRYQLFLSNDKDFLTTRVSYKLNLRGPSVDIQTACSTSLVAVHFACQSLLSGECDMALAGGVSLSSPTGYLYQEGGIYSQDGHCRAFDADAQGTIAGSGLGVVVLKRLEDALRDGDYIDAVIKGSALNNDGALKVSYTAPRIDTQAAVIRAAQAVAEVNPETITYIETHGTGTALGDPIEIAALTQAFRSQTDKTGYCAIASVKSNIGHLDAAAGIASFIKTVLALKHKQVPPSLHFQQPNPQIDFPKTPFYVNTNLADWQTDQTPRRAGVSSFGIGGTNAHVILEEAPIIISSSASRPWQLLILSAKNPTALSAIAANLASHLKQHPEINLADVVYTLQVGRQDFDHRQMLLCQTTAEAIQILNDGTQILTQVAPKERREIAFLFPGQGSQYLNMGKELYATESVFRQQVDHCCELLQPHLGLDLRNLIYPELNTPLSSPLTKGGQREVSDRVGGVLFSELKTAISQTSYTQSALFVIEYALAQLWISWGIQPQAMIGNSIGEYVAATYAGVFSLPDALKLVAMRGKLMQQCPPGAMLSVAMSADTLQPLLSGSLVIAANNAPQLSVVSGTEVEITQLEQYLNTQNITYRRLQTSHAFHSPLMDEIIAPFIDAFRGMNLRSPQIPFISNVTGDWITPEQATNPDYWATHLRQPVQFANGVTELLKEPNRILLEVGPGKTLTTLAKQQTHTQTILSSLRHPQENQSDVAFLLQTLGELWLAGVPVDWSGFYAHEQRHRLPLPTYSFQRQRYWIDPPALSSSLTPLATTGGTPATQWLPNASGGLERGEYASFSDWFYIPTWERSLSRPLVDLTEQRQCLLVLADNYDVGTEIVHTLQNAGHDVIIVTPGEKYEQPLYRTFTVNPQQKQDFVDLLEDLQLRELIPDRILHLWNLTSANEYQNQSYDLLYLAQAISSQSVKAAIPITVVTNDGQIVLGNEEINPLKAMVLAMGKVISQEIPQVSCRCVDIVVSKETDTRQRLVQQLIRECFSPANEVVVAYRGSHRWEQIFKPVRIPHPNPPLGKGRELEPHPSPALGKGRELDRAGGVLKSALPLRQGGNYLIVGDLTTGLGTVYADFLAQMPVRLILLSDVIPEAIKQSLDDASVDYMSENVDITDREQLKQAIAHAEQKFGQLHGVFYSTPMSNEHSMALLHQLTPNHWNYNYRTKVQGLFALAEVIGNKHLDFCLLQSSLSSVLGGLGLAAYAAANAVIDMFAVKQNQVSTFSWISINWDACRDDASEINSGFGANLAALALTPQEVWDATCRVLSLGLPEAVIVSKSSLHKRLEQWVIPKSSNGTKTESSTENAHTRPNLANEYIPPSNEIEQAIAQIWQELLGITPIGIHDNFFDLGGHSLLAIQAISRKRDRFGIELSMRNLLYEAPTVAAIAVVVAAQQPQDIEEMTALLTEIQSLSPTEVAQQLTTHE
ncbi:type I polyketide synthase [Nostoc favosum]|uniref:SDR family NAD(P)-dependent oxidoreductase n=1 Tax=Nostoc favosum CHAB5714 TaxID=2780399 RepID=A0ABS8IEY8_9NOSO|nr:type I polyketide synthase [Nostoc favosum]MCC5602616.1 SDR family NAD(P)-dependent oxidoreductase [Nostoc favosum CHAB5714]